MAAEPVALPAKIPAPGPLRPLLAAALLWRCCRSAQARPATPTTFARGSPTSAIARARWPPTPPPSGAGAQVRARRRRSSRVDSTRCRPSSTAASRCWRPPRPSSPRSACATPAWCCACVARATSSRSGWLAIYRTASPTWRRSCSARPSFADLLERTDFLRRVNRQDTRVIDLVAARATRAALGGAAARARRAPPGRRRRRDAPARRAGQHARGARGARDSYGRAKRARLAALKSTRSGRKRLQGELDKLLAEQARAERRRSGPSGSWAIPWSVVQCESGGQNMPPNWAGASGYYQIIPSTWRLFGGSGPAAYLASRGEQDRVASGDLERRRGRHQLGLLEAAERHPAARGLSGR